MNIVLIGMRGSGKTTVGKILAARLGRKLVDMDDLIARKAGSSIPSLVQVYGWEKFRDIEEEVAAEVAAERGIINAAGGGVVTREGTVRALKKSGMLVWLEADAGTLLRRVGGDSNRPPLVAGRTRQEDMEITLEERGPLYRRAADIVVDTGGITPEAVAETVLGLIAARGGFDD